VIRLWPLLGEGLRALVIAGLAVLLPASAAMAQDRSQLTVSQEAGFGRLILSFPDRHDLPPYSIKADNNVLAIEFEAPIAISLPDVSGVLPEYLAVARSDPDRQGLRFGLRMPLTFHTIEAGEKLFVDLLPPGWRGLPPGLPEATVAELSRRAQQAAEEAMRNFRAEEAARLKPEVTLRVGRNPSFLRLQFDWSEDTRAEFSQEGAVGTLRFDWPVAADLFGLTSALPEEIRAARTRVDVASSEVVLTLAEGVKPRFYQTGSRQAVLDIDLMAFSSRAVTVQELLAQSDAGRLAAGAIAEVDAAAEMEAAEIASGQAGAELPRPALTRIVPTVSAVGGTVRVTFPFDQDTPAAVFRRGDALWMIFDSATAVEAPADMAELGQIATGLTATPSGDTQIVRLDLSQDRLATLGSEGRAWVLSLGDVLLAPTEPLALTRRVDPQGWFEVVADLQRPARIHQFRDPVVGDNLEVVTVFPPARGVVRNLEFVDFTALRSVHGLVMKPARPEVNIAIESRLAVIRAEGGLSVSSLEAPRTTIQGLAEARAGLVELSSMVADNPIELIARQEQLMTEAARAEGEGIDRARLDLGRFYLANQYGAEALGVLQVAQADLKAGQLRPALNMAIAAAMVVAARPADALASLGAAAQTGDPEALVWRTMARRDLLDFAGARSDALVAEPLIASYPRWVRTRFLMSAGRAAIETGDTDLGEHFLALLDTGRLSAEERATVTLLNARIDDIAGRQDEALDTYGQVVATDIRPLRAEAVYRTLDLLDRRGDIDVPRAIATLAAESMLWRGDALEAQMQKLLAELYFRGGQYRLGFETVRQVVAHYPESPPMLQLAQAAQDVFTGLFLDGEADALEPVEALSLFYDFRQLTPPGNLGDEMIRNLVHRLVQVDLLAQASDLLEYQLDNRLTGMAKAQVAADLAVIEIANREPEAALSVLTRTQLADLSPTLERQRRVLQARALIDAGRDELALDMLSRMNGRDADLLRVDAHWAGKRFSSAAEVIESIYGDDTRRVLSSVGRMTIVKAGVGYVLANDSIGLSRLRDKFSAVMAETPEWPLFDFITGKISPQTAEFRRVAQEVSGLDSIAAFLSAYRQSYDGPLVPKAPSPLT